MARHTLLGVVILFLIYVFISNSLFKNPKLKNRSVEETQIYSSHHDHIEQQPLMVDKKTDLPFKDKYMLSKQANPTTEPCQHVAFLKVHKAASSTTQNIFLRYGYDRNLTFVLPRPPKFFYPNIISTVTSVNNKNILPPPVNKHYDILCCHVIYNRKAFEAIMPKDTAYIGIVREPSEHIRSIIQYFRPKEIYERFNSTDPIADFFKNPGRTLRNTQSYLNNRMAFEYDFPRSLFYSKDNDGINNYLRKLANEFHLVIVVEYFDESIVLMRRILNWSIKDILYVKLNESKKDKKPKISLEDKQRHREWAVLEYALYDFFYKRLWDQIKEEGKDFVDELYYFKSVRTDVTNFCSGPIANKTSFKAPKSKWNDEFIVSEKDCELMFKKEIEFVNSIKLFQYGDLIYRTLNDTTKYY
ncbi:hypothetical protein KUTeg_019040 [Tegillarca granosa]|uniref:Galactose-3-O-sulfotransferase 3 n=1 Tax=Tegillarca granosa TaxID=220873 RepID=A0ABQ9EBD1_TEGGR|nr:hypothetical protein KUTeg_019040 [Tegillarca granosa]